MKVNIESIFIDGKLNIIQTKKDKKVNKLRIFFNDRILKDSFLNQFHVWRFFVLLLFDKIIIRFL